MESNDDFVHILNDCIDMLNENTDVLNDIEYSLKSEKEDFVIPNMSRNDLVDMAHDVSESSRIKRAESDFVRRLLEKSD